VQPSALGHCSPSTSPERGWLALAQTSLPCQLLGHRGGISALCHRGLEQPTHPRGWGCGEAAVAPGTEGLCAAAVLRHPQLSRAGPGCPHAVARCPHHPRGNQHRAAHQQEGEAAAAEEGQGEHGPGSGRAGRGRAGHDMCLPGLQVFRNPYSYGSWDNWKVFLGVDLPR